MPIKQVVCSICKETVNKAVTYHVGGTDRACRKHEGVEEKKAALDQAKAQKAEALTRKAERRQEPMWSEPSEAMVPKCWVCMNTGLRQQEFFMRVLVEMKKYEKIHGKPVNLFDQKQQVQMKERCIFLLTKEKAAAALKYVREDFRQIVDMASVISICGQCCGTFKIEALAPAKDVRLEDALLFGSLIQPVLDEMAGQEMARDN